MQRVKGGELLTGVVAAFALREGWMQIPEEIRQLVCSVMICLGPAGAGIFFAIASNAKWMRSK